MFVRFLVLLISHVLYCFSVLVCYRSLVQIVIQRGGIEQRWNLGPCKCDQAHLVSSSALRSSPRGTIKRTPRSTHKSRVALAAIASLPASWEFQRQLRAIDLTPHDRMHCIRSNAHEPDDRTHGIRSNTHGPAIERTTAIKRTPDLAAH
jgi:hypothetical protein